MAALVGIKSARNNLHFREIFNDGGAVIGFAATPRAIGARGAGQEKDTRSIEAGKFANLLVLANNPLAIIKNIRSVVMVVKHGIRYPRSEYQPVTAEDFKGTKKMPCWSAYIAGARQRPTLLW